MKREITNKLLRSGKTLWYREFSSDLTMWNENSYRKLNINQNDVVMDIGANIGDFPLRYAEKVKWIHSYEPIPETFEVLKKNVESNNIKNCNIYESAITTKGGEISIFLNEEAKMAHAAASILPIRGRTEFKVSSVNFSKEVKRLKPTVIKMDIEGAEKFILDEVQDDLFNDCRIFVVETHLTFLRSGAEEWNRSMGERFHKLFGFSKEHKTWYFNKHHCSVWTFERK